MIQREVPENTSSEDQEVYVPKKEIEKKEEPEVVTIYSEKTSLIIKSVCALVCVAMVVLVVFNIISFCQNQSSTGKGSYLTLQNKNATDTKKILKDFGKENQKKLKDYSFLGSKLYLSENKLDASCTSNSDYFYDGNNTGGFLGYNMTNKIRNSVSTNFESNKLFIDFNKADVGDYFIYPNNEQGSIEDKDYNFYSIFFDDIIEEQSYSLPDKDGIRNRITLKNNVLSPYTMVSLSSAGKTLPGDVYDIVVFLKEYNDDVKQTINSEEVNLFSETISKINIDQSYGLKIKVASSLQDAIDTKANVSICYANSTTDYSTYCSIYNNYKVNGDNKYKTEILDSSSILADYDLIPEIRECIGYMDRAGQSNYKVIGNNTKQSNSKIGKDAYLISGSDETFIEDFKNLVLDLLV